MGNRPLVGTLSDEHLIGTAVRRLQEPAGWVPAALNAMLLTPWSSHLNLQDRPRLQRPANDEPIEAGTLPRFIEILHSTNQESEVRNVEVDAG